MHFSSGCCTLFATNRMPFDVMMTGTDSIGLKRNDPILIRTAGIAIIMLSDTFKTSSRMKSVMEIMHMNVTEYDLKLEGCLC